MNTPEQAIVPRSGAAVRIRDAGEDEWPAIRDLTLRAYSEYAAVMTPSAWTALEGALRSALAAGANACERIVAERGGALMGSVMLFPPAVAAYEMSERALRCPELRLLAVAPEARGLGIGEALVDECIRRARQSGATELGLHTSMSMRAAIALYERKGFRRTPDQDFQLPGSEQIEAYRKVLGSRF